MHSKFQFPGAWALEQRAKPRRTDVEGSDELHVASTTSLPTSPVNLCLNISFTTMSRTRCTRIFVGEDGRQLKFRIQANLDDHVRQNLESCITVRVLTTFHS